MGYLVKRTFIPISIEHAPHAIFSSLECVKGYPNQWRVEVRRSDENRHSSRTEPCAVKRCIAATSPTTCTSPGDAGTVKACAGIESGFLDRCYASGNMQRDCPADRLCNAFLFLDQVWHSPHTKDKCSQISLRFLKEMARVKIIEKVLLADTNKINL